MQTIKLNEGVYTSISLDLLLVVFQNLPKNKEIFDKKFLVFKASLKYIKDNFDIQITCLKSVLIE